jgi:hypothetical protein
MTISGEEGLVLTVVEATPAPPRVGTNVFSLRLEDEAGEGLAGATLGVLPVMPDHGHGTPRRPVVTDEGDGAYRVANVYLYMPGYWSIRMQVSHPSLDDRAYLRLCVRR